MAIIMNSDCGTIIGILTWGEIVGEETLTAMNNCNSLNDY